VGIPLFFLKNWVGLTHLTLNRPFLESVSLKNYLKTDTFTTLVKCVPTTVNERFEHINKNSSIMRPYFTVQAFKLRGIVEQSKSISRSRNNV